MIVDSTHDGLPLYDYTSGHKKEIDRIHLQGTGPQRRNPCNGCGRPNRPAISILCGEPVRGPILGTYLVGKTVMPALGQEGELIAAWGAARVVTRSDRARQKMRRQMWSKIETS